MVDVHETSDVHIVFSLPQMRNLGTTIELDPLRDKITCPAFGLFSSPSEYSTMGHIVLDLTSLTCQPTTKSSDRSGHPKRHATFAMSEQRTTNLLYVRQQERNRSKKDVIKPLMTKTLHLWFIRDLQDLLKPHSESEQMRPRFRARKQK